MGLAPPIGAFCTAKGSGVLVVAEADACCSDEGFGVLVLASCFSISSRCLLISSISSMYFWAVGLSSDFNPFEAYSATLPLTPPMGVEVARVSIAPPAACSSTGSFLS